ncbi:MAG: FAD binding domain-containing protein [Pseudonocardiales bacterium]
MKPPPFAYSAPGTVTDALALLAALGPDGKVLAGGQSLVPLLNMRLAAPAHLVDINGLEAELGAVEVTDAGVRVGALARHSAVEASAPAVGVLPLLRQALTQVAHPVIRNRGTVVGSLAHADPSAELPAVLCLVGGSVQVASAGSERIVAAADLFAGPMETCLRPGELIVSAWFPALPERTTTAFLEVTRRHGDYAVCGVAVAVTRDPDGAITGARAAYVSVSDTPLVLDLTDALVTGEAAGDRVFAAARLAAASVSPDDDIHATAGYRRHLAGVLTARALRAAS